MVASLFACWYWGYEGKRHFAGNARGTETRKLNPEGPFWDHGLFECGSEPTLCCLACCCSAVRWAHTMAIVGEMSFMFAFLVYALSYGLDSMFYYVGLPGTTIL